MRERAMNDTPPVVAGVDGSPSSIAAAEYAAELADRRHAPLELLHAYQQVRYSWDLADMPWRDEASDEQVRSEIELELADLAERLRRAHPRLAGVEARQVHATAAGVLIGRSSEAQVTVVGSRGAGGFAELLVGSVSWQVASHGHGPVIVVRPPIADQAVASGPEQPRSRRPLGPVMVAYDGSPGAEPALEFAVTEALQRGARLRVTNVYTHAEDVARQILTDAVKPYTATHPELDVELLTIESDRTAAALVEAGRDAALTVVGSRGRGGFAGLVLGSVGRTLVHHASGPVAVVHATEKLIE
jgi:nucleotide-binding universal stress UspA family protein